MEATPWTKLGSDPSRPGHRTSTGVMWCLAAGRWLGMLKVLWVGEGWYLHWIGLVLARLKDA